MKNLQQEKILENEIEIMANNIEIENAKREEAAIKEVIAFKEKQLEELMQILLERGYAADEIKELTK